MKIGIYGAGQFVSRINKDIPYIAVDGGILSLNKLEITPQYIVGDFDSCQIDLVNQYKNLIQLPRRKDYADTEVAIQYAIELGYDEIELYGVTGGRLDHFMAILRILVKYQSISIVVIDEINKLYLLKKGQHKIFKDTYNYISFFSINQTSLTLNGVEYPLNNYLLTYDNPLCLSNEIIDEYCYVENSDLIYCIQSKKGEF